MKVHRELKYSFIYFSLNTKWRSVISFDPSCFISRKEAQYLRGIKVGGPQGFV
jgi:hypothetical protein